MLSIYGTAGLVYMKILRTPTNSIFFCVISVSEDVEVDNRYSSIHRKVFMCLKNVTLLQFYKKKEPNMLLKLYTRKVYRELCILSRNWSSLKINVIFRFFRSIFIHHFKYKPIFIEYFRCRGFKIFKFQQMTTSILDASSFSVRITSTCKHICEITKGNFTSHKNDYVELNF